MGSKLIIEPQAQFIIDEAIKWYESKQIGLGLEFLNYLDGYFKILKETDVIFQIKREPVYRELPLKRFPYVIIYERTKNETYVYSVFNTHQNQIKKTK